MYVTISITILFHLIHILVSDGEALCKSPQYLERGKRGLVECQFPESFFGILWYNTSDYLNNDPIAYVKGETERGGLGYESNEYYISSNGSLIINEVSLQDDRNFTAVILESPRDEYSPNNIHVIVTVRPYQMQPHIEGCNVDEQLCIKMLNGSSQISCSVTDSRPAVDLNWYRNDFSMDHLLSSTKNVTFENHLYTTIVKTMYSPNMNENVVYVCKSVSAPLLMKNEYSVVLIRNILNKFEESKPTIVYAKHVSSIELPCTEEPVLYLFWKKTGHDNRSEDLIHFVSINKSSFTKFQSHYYHLTNQRSLRIAEIDVQDEGLYTCSFSDGILEKVKVFNLQVYVMPDPEYPIVEGCHDGGYCSLTVPRTGELKCLLKGIRPKVKLRWETVNDDQKFSINFSIISHKVVANELKFDILLTSHFRIQKSFTGWLPIRCIAVDRGGIPFDISREVYVSQLKGPSQEDESKEAVNTKEGGKNGENFNRWLPFVGTALVIGVATAVCVIFYVVERRRGVERRRPHRHSDTEEDEYLMPNDKPSEEKVSKFKSELKMNYRDICEAINPLPYDKECRYRIEKIYVECAIEELEKSEEERDKEGKLPRKVEVWRKLKSHNDILEKTCTKNTRVIIEGDPGYGKSTLAFRLAYDWYTKDENSPLKEVDIFILLRLRHLKNVASIPAAVKRFLLSKDSLLTVGDVRKVLSHSESLLIYLDGFNRYPNQIDAENNVISDVLMKNTFKNSQVIVTTRPSCLPREYANVTKRLRLTGFGKNTWKKYIRQAVPDENLLERKKITDILHQNPFLSDLCQVPLFCALLVHISKSDDTFENSQLQTVTKFFEKLMDSFYSKITFSGDNDHSALCKICFEELVCNNNALLWKKKDICHKLGKTLYEKYRRIGVLVEEQFQRSYKGGPEDKKNVVLYETKVRFYHNIFCEWYAACKLCTVTEKSNQEKAEEYFRKINRYDHQYVFRFACGMNSRVASKVITYVQSTQDGGKFAILCLAEQSENYEKAYDDMKKICTLPISISEHDSLFLQRSTIQLLDFASKKGVEIESVWLGGMYSSVELSNESLELILGLVFPKLVTLTQLTIREPGREFTGKELVDVLKYADLCPALKSLSFRACMMPFSLGSEELELCGYRNVEDRRFPLLEWKYSHGSEWHRLNVQTGKWEFENREMSQVFYETLKESFNTSLNASITQDDSIPQDITVATLDTSL